MWLELIDYLGHRYMFIKEYMYVHYQSASILMWTFSLMWTHLDSFIYSDRYKLLMLEMRTCMYQYLSALAPVFIWTFIYL